MGHILRWFGALSLLFACEAANILVVILMPSFSHQIPALSLSAGLLHKGHQVTYIGTNSLLELDQHENYSFVDLSFAYRGMSGSNTSNSTINFQQKLSRWVWPKMYENSFNLAREEVQSEAFQRVLREVKQGERQYDSIIIEGKYSLILVPLLRRVCGPKPVIAFASLSLDTVIENQLGSIQHLSYVPMLFNGYSDRMSLWQRIDNWVSTLWVWWSLQRRTLAVAREILAENGLGEVDEDEVYRNVSLFMVASGHIYHYPRMLAPNVVMVGPLHIRDSQKQVLPQDVQSWLDGAQTGVIYVSFGSNMKSASLPPNALKSLVSVLSKVPSGYRVLWKWESSNPMPGKTDNILTKNWLPQQGILAHPKVKLFITQGGLQSFQEAVHYAVPLVGVPFFGDQNMNTEKIATSGIGVKLDLSDLTDPKLVEEAINKTLFDEGYASRMKRHSKMSQDFTASGLDNAVKMVEHVTSFGGDHLRPATAGISYAAFLCWDILGILSLSIAFFIISLKFLCKFI